MIKSFEPRLEFSLVVVEIIVALIVQKFKEQFGNMLVQEQTNKAYQTKQT